MEKYLIIMAHIGIYRRLALCCLAWLLIVPVFAGEKACPMAVDVPTLDSELVFSFYGKSLQVAKLHPAKVQSMGESDVAEAWNSYKNKVEVDAVLSSLRTLSDELGLNDWFVFELVRDYVNALLNNCSPLDRMVLDHYLLVGMGYDVHLARTERQLVLLVPIKQAVYEHQFVRVGDKEFYLFFDDEESAEEKLSVIVACDPSKKDVGEGHSINLLFDNTSLKVRSGEDRLCELDDGKIRITCTVNEGIMEMLRNYPMMDLQNYVTSVVMPQFQDTILGQLRPQIEDMTQCEAANALLHFVQYVFGYENDSVSHGREKAYLLRRISTTTTTIVRTAPSFMLFSCGRCWALMSRLWNIPVTSVQPCISPIASLMATAITSVVSSTSFVTPLISGQQSASVCWNSAWLSPACIL